MLTKTSRCPRLRRTSEGARLRAHTPNSRPTHQPDHHLTTPKGRSASPGDQPAAVKALCRTAGSFRAPKNPSRGHRTVVAPSSGPFIDTGLLDRTRRSSRTAGVPPPDPWHDSAHCGRLLARLRRVTPRDIHNKLHVPGESLLSARSAVTKRRSTPLRFPEQTPNSLELRTLIHPRLLATRKPQSA